MIELKMTIPMMQKAHAKATDMGTLNNSVMNGKGNFIGFLGEEVALSYMGGLEDNSYDYDMFDPYGNAIDVKTKLTTVTPLPHYECSITAFNTFQKCDMYAFVRIKKDLSKAWFLGLKDKKQYYEEAVFMKKGTIDPSNNWRVRADCYNLRIDKLDEYEVR